MEDRRQFNQHYRG